MSAQTRTLVITPHSALFPTQGVVVCSGGWCLTPSSKEFFAQHTLSQEVLPYHWDDRQKYRQDYEYLIKVYEMYLANLSDHLDHMHQQERGVEYWRILAGPALYTILCHLIDRWEIAQTILNQARFDHFKWIAFPKYHFTPKLTLDLNPDNHDYNHFLILSALFALGIDITKGEKIVFQQSSAHTAPPLSSPPLEPLQQRVWHLLRRAFHAFSYGTGLIKRNPVLILSSYLPRIYEILLNFGCKSFPVKAPIHSLSMPEPHLQQREAIQFQIAEASPFCKFVSAMLPTLLPTYLIEGYPALTEKAQTAGWPVKPRSIFTANAFQFNEVFQHYTAFQKTKHHAKLVIGQHGGVSGILDWSYGEDHQIQIADQFVSWGWNPHDKKIIPGFVLTNSWRSIQPKKKGCLLLTTVPVRRYSHKGGAWPVGPQQSDAFLAAQLAFYKELEGTVAEHTVLRIHVNLDRRFESGYISAWRNEFPQIKIDPSIIPIRKVFHDTRLFVYTYNSTGYLESLAMNFPTIMFWDPNLFETKPAFTAALADLARVGIFHTNPRTAAQHINQVWGHVLEWWASSEVQQARLRFTSQYARPPSLQGLRLLHRVLVD